MDAISPSELPTGRDVLVVEDEVRIRNMLNQALREMGYHATLTSTAEAATKALSQRSFDILILDLNLPGMGGLDFLECTRGRHRETQVIILTGFGDLESAQKAIHLDVVEFLTKPCTLGNLESALERARRRRRGQIVGEPGAHAEPRLQFETAPAPQTVPSTETSTSPLSLEDIEQKHILNMLQKNLGNRAATAAELGISLRKLYYRLGEYQKKGLIP